MTKSDHRKPINFVGMYFIDEHGEDYRWKRLMVARRAMTRRGTLGESDRRAKSIHGRQYVS
jgi:hypothetical protein